MIKFRAEYLVFLVIFLMLIFENSVAQYNWSETDQYICWQESRELTPIDFLGVVGDCGLAEVDNISIEASACLGIWAILDIPKTWKKGVEYERFYFAPVFDKNISWTQTNDTIEIKKQQVYFNICELSSRWARRELYDIRKQANNATGTSAIYFLTVKEKMNTLKKEIYASYFDAVFRTNSLNSWVNFTQKMLLETQEYATTQKEFQRLLTGKSEKGYKQAEKVIGAMNK